MMDKCAWKACPFCGGKPIFSTVGRSWYRIEADHEPDCLLDEYQFDCPQRDEDLDALRECWNTRN